MIEVNEKHINTHNGARSGSTLIQYESNNDTFIRAKDEIEPRIFTSEQRTYDIMFSNVILIKCC